MALHDAAKVVEAEMRLAGKLARSWWWYHSTSGRGLWHVIRNVYPSGRFALCLHGYNGEARRLANPHSASMCRQCVQGYTLAIAAYPIEGEA